MREQLQFSPVKLTGRAWYNLVLAETESKDKAEEALQAYIAAELRANRKPEV